MVSVHAGVVIAVIVCALIFDFTNGVNDSGNIVATMISTRAMSPRTALIIASVFEFLGAVCLGTAVARMIAGGIVDPVHLTGSRSVWMILAALAGAITWNVCSWFMALPSSSSHALMGGLIGVFVSDGGWQVLIWKNIVLIGIIMVAAPVLSFIFAFLMTRVIYFFGQWMTSRAHKLFKHMQLFSSIGLAVSHGTNDAQKTMGIITLTLLAAGWISYEPGQMVIPLWVKIVCALTISLGIGIGARRIMHTLGMKLYKIRPVNGFCSQSASAAVVYGAAFFGYVVSTTQTVSSSIAGTGSADNIKKVRWGTFGEIIFAWVITMPAAAVVGALCFGLFRGIGVV